MGSEDFAESAVRKPTAHVRIGSRREGRETMLHCSDFDLNEACIPTAIRTLSLPVVKLMARRQQT